MRGTLSHPVFVERKYRFIPACAGNTSFQSVAGLSAPVHPRLCGEHFPHLILWTKEDGSSPPVRGTQRVGYACGAADRFIPACAGNTLQHPLKRQAGSVHPRLCGEHTDILSPVLQNIGSSPPVRGNTGSISQATVGRPVHPRLCGEHAWNELHPQALRGSSPPVRGTLLVCDHDFGANRFIPACAGNTKSFLGQPHSQPVHPRLCGEHRRTFREFSSTNGSSPPVRGTPDRKRRCRWRLRFIPACAGNTTCRDSTGQWMPVHPRLCGEHIDVVDIKAKNNGSSPPVRGTPFFGESAASQRRFIPACAGNTGSQPGANLNATVHPRLCGEHRACFLFLSRARGSSPPVRGTRQRYRHRPVAYRFIPACAGNTMPRCPQSRTAPVHPRLCGEHKV